MPTAPPCQPPKLAPLFYHDLQMLNDHEWAAAFLQRNQRSLEESYDALTGELGGRFVLTWG